MTSKPQPIQSQVDPTKWFVLSDDPFQKDAFDPYPPDIELDNANRARAEAQLAAAEFEPYIHLAEDLLTLIPDLNAYVIDDGVWDFAEVSRAAEHRRGKGALDQFEILVSQ